MIIFSQNCPYQLHLWLSKTKYLCSGIQVHLIHRELQKNKLPWTMQRAMLSSENRIKSCLVPNGLLPMSGTTLWLIRRSLASRTWLLAPFGSRSVPQLIYIDVRWSFPNFLWTWKTENNKHLKKSTFLESETWKLCAYFASQNINTSVFYLKTWKWKRSKQKRIKVWLTFAVR